MSLPREVAAEKIGVSDLTLHLWEEGVGGPTIGELRKMAGVYRKPLATLLMSRLPKGEEPIKVDLRLLAKNQNRPWSPTLRLSLWRVQMQRDVAIELAKIREELPSPLDLSLSLDEDIDEVGSRVRLWLEVDASRPVNRYGKRDFSQWINLIESKAILVTQISFVDLDEMRGCSISDQPLPVIVLNGSDAPNGKTFSLMHELIHVLLHAGGLCDMEDKCADGESTKARIERYCNEVAAALLMPRATLLLDSRIAGASPNTLWPDEEITGLASRFGVSREALLLRLVSLGVASWSQYGELRPHYQEEAERRHRKPIGWFMPLIQRKVRDFGRRYSLSVLDAYYREEITGPELANYLDIKLNNVPKLEERLGVRR